MKTHEIRALAQKVLSVEWAPIEIGQIDVTSREDHLGEDALFLEARLLGAPSLLAASKFIAGQRELRDALLEADEKRFPYLRAVDATNGAGLANTNSPAPVS